VFEGWVKLVGWFVGWLVGCLTNDAKVHTVHSLATNYFGKRQYEDAISDRGDDNTGGGWWWWVTPFSPFGGGGGGGAERRGGCG